MKRILIIILALVMLLAGCGSASDTLDDQVEQLASEYSEQAAWTPELQDVMNTLDLMLEQYVSGLKKPAASDIPHTTLDIDGQDLFKDTTITCATEADMKQLLLEAMTDTLASVQFYAPNSYYTNDVLYSVIFEQLCDEYMIQTMGMQEYRVTTMPVAGHNTAVQVEFCYFQNQYTLQQVQDMKNETLSKAKALVRDLNLPNLTVFERIQAVNDYLTANCVYPDTEPYSCESHSPYGALIEQSAVCEGYARAAQLIFELCDVPSYYVVGETPNGGHAWNLVQVDGNWYQLDVTWNDTTSNPNMYFLVTDDYMALSRTWDRQKYPVTATTPYQ